MGGASGHYEYTIMNCNRNTLTSKKRVHIELPTYMRARLQMHCQRESIGMYCHAWTQCKTLDVQRKTLYVAARLLRERHDRVRPRRLRRLDQMRVEVSEALEPLVEAVLLWCEVCELR